VRVVDVSDPAAPRLIATETLPSSTFSRVLSLDASGDRAYLGEWAQLYSYQLLPNLTAADIRFRGTSLLFPPTASGEESALNLIVENDGVETLEVTSIVGTDDFVPLSSSLSIPPGGTDFVEVRFRPQTGGPLTSDLTLTTNDPDEANLTFPVTGNQPGLHVGDKVPDWTWIDLQSSQGISTGQLAGNVIVLSYFATF